MTENTKPTHLFELKDILTMLVRHQEIHEGIWSLGVEFGFGAANFGQTKETVFPSAFAQVLKLGLNAVDIEGPLTVDAAKVNPAPKIKKKPATSAKVKAKETSKTARPTGKILTKK